jgi:hypothetical protein
VGSVFCARYTTVFFQRLSLSLFLLHMPLYSFHSFIVIFPEREADNWPPTDQEYVVLYIHSPLRLHGVLLKHLYTGTALIFTRRKVAGSRRDEVMTFFNLPNPSGPTRPWGSHSL